MKMTLAVYGFASKVQASQ